VTGKKGDRVGFQSFAVAGGKGLNQTGNPGELISREGVGDNEDSPMRPPVIEELNYRSGSSMAFVEAFGSSQRRVKNGVK